ncbi:MAG TPA: hypothetical protein EYQ50_24535 [Verrucomicrobiales bacterium]|nr:hypothetical protein [Verrucomicrobiales bacterium]
MAHFPVVAEARPIETSQAAVNGAHFIRLFGKSRFGELWVTPLRNHGSRAFASPICTSLCKRDTEPKALCNTGARQSRFYLDSLGRAVEIRENKNSKVMNNHGFVVTRRKVLLSRVF